MPTKQCVDKKCDICHQSVGSAFIDGRTRMGPWANMCKKCHILQGQGFGIGRGQLYELKDGQWLQTRGGSQPGLKA